MAVQHPLESIQKRRFAGPILTVNHRNTVIVARAKLEGRPYRSLSAIARAITGTRWNGLVFFGLKNQRAA
jgi:hypothetical protein